MRDRRAGHVPGVHRASADAARLARYAAHRDRRDLEALVSRYRPLALALARRYAGRRHAMDDLAQVAYVGLIKALQRFDPERNCSFATFAVPTILGELRRFCRDTGYGLHVPRGMQERIVAVRRAREEVSARRGRTATVAEVAAALGWDDETVFEALLASSARSIIPLESEVGESDEPCSLLDLLGDVDPGFELVESLSALEGPMRNLTRAEQRVLRLRFEEDLSLQEVGARLALSPPQAARALSSALQTLRRAVGAEAGEMAAQTGSRERRRRVAGPPLARAA